MTNYFQVATFPEIDKLCFSNETVDLSLTASCVWPEPSATDNKTK